MTYIYEVQINMTQTTVPHHHTILKKTFHFIFPNNGFMNCILLQCTMTKLYAMNLFF
jgi:hypothetical protein